MARSATLSRPPLNGVSIDGMRELRFYTRRVGRYSESVDLLAKAYEAHKRTLTKDFPGTLSCAKSLAVSLRRAGLFEDAHRLTVATQARGDSITSPLRSARCRRSRASWATSSASVTDPSSR